MGIDYENPSKMYLILGGEVAQIIEFDGIAKDLCLQFDIDKSHPVIQYRAGTTIHDPFILDKTFTLSGRYKNARIQLMPKSERDTRHELSIDELNEILTM